MVNTKTLNKIATDIEKNKKRKERRRELYALKKEEIRKEAVIQKGVKKALRRLGPRCEESAKNGEKYLPLITTRSTSGNDSIDFWHPSERDEPECFHEIASRIEEHLEKKNIDHDWRHWDDSGVATWSNYALCVVWDGINK